MEYQSQTKNCQNCKKDFTIEPEDFLFYEKMKVPAPTFCPECRLQRRLTRRNERTLYRRKCQLCSNNTLTSFSSNSSFNVFCQDCWWGDKWDPMPYGKDLDFFNPILKQFQEILFEVPLSGLFNLQYVNSDYCNFTYQSKNCYLNFASDMNEDTGFLYHSIENRNSYDLLGSRKNENCYELIDSEGCYGSSYLSLSEGCIDCKYCYDCNNCSNCIGCFGLRNAKYYIFNKKYTPEEYNKEISHYNFGNKNDNLQFKETFKEILKKYPRKYFNSRHAIDCTGDYIKNSQNCKNCFDIEGPAKDLKYTIYGVTTMQNIQDVYGTGVNVENCYEVLGTGDNVQNIKNSMYIFRGSYDCQYSYFLYGCSNCFFCISLRNKQYCILNKQYTKEQYEELVPKIIKHMNDMPYIDSKGRVYKYGEFFPSELSPFCYNETIAQEYFPLTKEQALEQGYRWKDKEERKYNVDIKTENIPDDITNIKDEDILNKIIECKNKGDEKTQCTEAFKIIPEELQFYKRMNIPIPHLCPNCRHYERLSERNPMKLWHRSCMKPGCINEFETSYSPDRPEIIYCEKCYQQEVY